uniref:Uncharacterized protein n=1 Tax=Arundo donax TaxID=35708 RepID=A0A0A8YBL0_ARUDO
MIGLNVVLPASENCGALGHHMAYAASWILMIY